MTFEHTTSCDYMSNPTKGPKLEESSITLFKSIGLTQAKAAEASKSPKCAALLKKLIEDNSLVSRKLDEKQAGLIAAFASQLAKSNGIDSQSEKYVLDTILDGKLKSVDQVAGVFMIYI